MDKVNDQKSPIWLRIKDDIELVMLTNIAV